MTNDFPPAFSRQYDSHLKHLKLKGLQPKTIDAYARAIRRLGGYFDHRIDVLSEAQLTEYFSDLIPAPDPATRPAQGLPPGTELRLPALQLQKPNCLAAPSPQGRTAHAAQRETPAGASFPLLRCTDAGHPATDSGLWGQATKFGADGGDGRVNYGHGKDDAPTGTTAALGLKSPQYRVSTTGFAESARSKR